MKTKNKLGPGDDREMILDPSRWPVWPYLPLKRRNNSLEDRNLGVLVATETPYSTVYYCYLFAMPANLEDFEKTEYKSVDDLLADDWVVD